MGSAWIERVRGGNWACSCGRIFPIEREARYHLAHDACAGTPEPIRKQLRIKRDAQGRPVYKPAFAPRPGCKCDVCGDRLASVHAEYSHEGYDQEVVDYCAPCYEDQVRAKTEGPSQAEVDDAIASIQTAVQNGASE